MLAYQAGDEGAFDALVHRYSGQVFGLLTRFLGERAGREDLVQEVFLRVIRARERYRAEARFSTWLYRIAYNLSANFQARSGRREALSLDYEGAGGSMPEPEDASAPDPSRGLEQSDVVHAVREAIDALPENQRMALVLAKYEELPYSEIAVVLESSEKAIKSLVHRARENLRAALGAYLEEDFA